MSPPVFSVVVPTRDRPNVIQKALASILDQDHGAFEVVVVVDGSTEPQLDLYQDLARRSDPRVRWHFLAQRAAGHGPSYARNHGVSKSSGRYVCFLDDDDTWTDRQHLSRLGDALEHHGQPVDLILSQQDAVHPDGRVHDAQVWVDGSDFSQGDGAGHGVFAVTVDQLMRIPRFVHPNCCVLRRQFFDAIGGFDESLRYEEDRDLYYRAIDASGLTMFNPRTIARHNIPSRERAVSASTAIDWIGKRSTQLRILDKAILHSHHRCVRRQAVIMKGDTARHLALLLESSGRPGAGIHFALQAGVARFSMKWGAYILLMCVRRLGLTVGQLFRP